MSAYTEDNTLANPGGLSLVQADRRGFTTVCPTVQKTTHLLELVDSLLEQADRNNLYHDLSDCTEDTPLAKTRGLSPCTGGQEWLNHGFPARAEATTLVKASVLAQAEGELNHGLPACTKNNLLARTRGFSPHTGGQE